MRPLPFLIAIVVAVLVAACGDDDDTGATSTPTTAESGEPTGTAEATEAVSETPVPESPTPFTGVCTENPDPAGPEVLQVEEPDPGADVTSPVEVRGLVAAFEAVFQIAIKDAEGNDIVSVTGHAEEGQVLSPFQELVDFSVERETDACVWVYQLSAADGSVIDVVQVPVRLQANP